MHNQSFAFKTERSQICKVWQAFGKKDPGCLLFDRRKRDNKQIFSVKLQKELSEKLITLALEQNLSFTDIIEYGLEKVFEELDVKVNHEVVRRYNSTRGKKK